MLRIVSRLLLLPIIAGLSYELTRLAGKSDSPIVKAIIYPGLLLQKLTTRQPDDDQLEVAITAFNAAMGTREEEEPDAQSQVDAGDLGGEAVIAGQES